MSEQDPKYIRDIEDVLKPRGFSSRVRALSSREQKSDPSTIIRELIVDIPSSFKAVKDKLDAHFTGTSKQKDTQARAKEENFSFRFSGLSKTHKIICEKEGYNDKLYWSMSLPSGSKEQSPELNTYFIETFKDARCEVSVMVSRDPYVSPSEAGTEDIEMFLNYTPPHIANRLVPYLEVQFISNQTVKALGENPEKPQSFAHLNTPGLMRFLLGSTRIEDFAPANRPLTGFMTIKGQKEQRDGKTQAVVFSQSRVAGMEMFLSPQSLTNMDSLKSSPTRLMDAKPFLPLASISSFEVTMHNAGAGDMVNKTGKLELKVHDKARLSEFSQFLRGGTGFSTGRIWTSFGWLGPLGVNAEDDKYAEFINTKMHAEHCWMVKNASFGFDAGGTVTLTLDLTTYGVSQSRKTSIKARSGNYEGYLIKFNRLLEEIALQTQSISEKTGLGPDARLMQLLNTAAEGKMLGNVEPQSVNKAIVEVINGYTSTGVLDQKQGADLIEKLRRSLDPGYAGEGADGNTKDHPGRQGVEQARIGSVVEILRDSTIGPDPFLPQFGANEILGGVTANEERLNYFNSRYIEELYYGLSGKFRPNIETVMSGSGDTNDKEKQSNAEKTEATPTAKDANKLKRLEIKLEKTPRYVSFGKLFVNNVIPAYLEANQELKSDPNTEIQVIFYRLNDECGPVSGQSVAEFACDTQRLAYEIDNQLKVLNKHDLTIDEFTRLLVRTQFNDFRSVGYGKLSRGLFKPFDKDNTQITENKDNPAYESNLAAWQAENPVFSPPIVELLVEVVNARNTKESFSSSRIQQLIEDKKNGNVAKNSIVRFHVYDRQANSRYLFKKFVEFSGGYEIGMLDDSKFRQKIKSGAYTKKQIDDFLEQLDPKDPNKKLSREDQLKLGESVGIEFKSPTGVNDPLVVKRQLHGPRGVRQSLRMLAPTLQIGANGTLITSVNLASKANDLGAAAFLVRQIQGKTENNANTTDPPPTGLEDSGGLPIRTFPATLSIASMGVPIARPYQDYFIDLGTGTTLDNLYSCKNVTHSIQPGKFTTSMEFMYTDGYGKFASPPTIQKILVSGGRALQKAKEDLEKQKSKEQGQKSGVSGGKGAGKSSAPRHGVTLTNGAKQLSYTTPTGADESTPISVPGNILRELRSEGIDIGITATPSAIKKAINQYNASQKKKADDAKAAQKAESKSPEKTDIPVGQKDAAPGEKTNDAKRAALIAAASNANSHTTPAPAKRDDMADIKNWLASAPPK